MPSTTYLLPDLEVDVGPGGFASCRLCAPVELNVEFVYDPGYPGCDFEPNGDPGEPGEPETFDFKRITAAAPLVLASHDCTLVLTVVAGFDLYDYLSEAQLVAIELFALRQVRARDAEARLDAHLEAQE